MYRDLIKGFADREYSEKAIALSNVSHSRIRELEVIGESIEIGEGDKGVDNPYSFQSCTQPMISINEQSAEIPYTLRSVGDVADSFNLLTGEYTQNVKAMTFTGDESWAMSASNDTNAVFTYRTNTDSLYSAGIRCNILTYRGIAGGYVTALNNGVGLYKWLSSGNQYNYFVVPLTVASSLEEWKAYLQANEVIFYYALAKPVITQAEVVELKASIPDTSIYLEEANNLGNVRAVLQVKE